LPPVDLTSTSNERPLPGRSLHKMGAMPAPNSASRWDSPWLAIAVGSLLGAAAAGGWLLYRVLGG
jgi:hypothetical protein